MTPEAVRARPAATLVLMRDGEDAVTGSPEVLLLRRSERSAFVPGGWVFPGGLVEQADCSDDVTALVSGISADNLEARLGLHDAHPPAIAYLVAAVRETFEECGILAGVRSRASGERATALRADVLEGRVTFADALRGMDACIAGDELAYFAHWITPLASPRRYDTRFFAARVAPTSEPRIDPREMTEALWMTPTEAVRRFEDGSLRMILPTIETLRHLATFPYTGAALAAMTAAVVTTRLPTSTTGGFSARPVEVRLASP